MVTRETLVDAIYGFNDEIESPEAHMSRLASKVERTRGIGYNLSRLER